MPHASAAALRLCLPFTVAAVFHRARETDAVTGHEKGHDQGHGRDRGHGSVISVANASGRQTPEELGFTSDGDVDSSSQRISTMSAEFCLDLGAKGFPLPVFKMLQAVDWNAQKYFEQIQAKGYVEDALQMTGPQDAMMKSDCVKDKFRGKTKHIFVGDSQMMSLRNAFHRMNGCPEIWWNSSTQEKRKSQVVGRLHSSTQQAPEATVEGCREDGVGSFVYWDAWAQRDLPVKAIKREMKQLELEPKEGDTVVVWVGSNFIHAARRMGVLLNSVDQLQTLGVKMVWDSPTFQDAAIMTATSTRDHGRDPSNAVPVTHTAITRRKSKGLLGSNQYQTEKALTKSGIEIPMTKRWQLTNRYRGLQCDGMHTDMRARDPLFYSAECPNGKQEYGLASNGCNWVEPFKADLADLCPMASGLDDLVLQSGLYSICAAHERPFCYQHSENIR